MVGQVLFNAASTTSPIDSLISIDLTIDGHTYSLGEAVDIYTRLVDEEGHKELASDLAHTLNNQAWLYVASSEPEFRDITVGKQYATRACELTDWKESGCLDSLAAACAASAEFDAAVKWQLKSIELAPDEQKAELRELLKRYRAKKPNRPS